MILGLEWRFSEKYKYGSYRIPFHFQRIYFCRNCTPAPVRQLHKDSVFPGKPESAERLKPTISAVAISRYGEFVLVVVKCFLVPILLSEDPNSCLPALQPEFPGDNRSAK